jgi:hypothetical protein
LALCRCAGKPVAANACVAGIVGTAGNTAGVGEAVDTLVFASVVSLAGDIARWAVALDGASPAGIIADAANVATFRQAAVDVGISARHVVVDALHNARATSGADNIATWASCLFA